MPDQKISQLTGGGAAQAADEFPIARSGGNNKILGKDLGKGLDAIVVSGLSLTGSQATTLADLAATWNTTGTPTAIKLNITDTASNANSLFIDIQKGGLTHFSVNKGGVCYAINGFSGPLSGNVTGNVLNGSINGDANKTWSFDSSNAIVGGRLRLDTSGNMFFGGVGLATSNQPAITADTTHILAQRNGTNAQTFRLYRTFTDASNYERLAATSGTHSSVTYLQLLAESAGTGAANLGIVLAPKGNGALTLQMPDGTTTGGDARGNRAVDFSTARSNSINVASGADSFIGACTNGRATGSRSALFGNGVSSGTASFACADATATGNQSFAAGTSCTAQGSTSVAIGNGSTASGQEAVALGPTATASGVRSIAMNSNAVAPNIGQFAYGFRGASGGAPQWSMMGLSNATTNATTTELFIEGVSNSRAVISANKTWMADINVVARSAGGTGNACFKRRCIIKRDGSNNTALVGTVQTIDTDIGSNAGAPPAGWAVTITADDTNESLKVEVTGAASTNIYWLAVLECCELTYA